MDQIRRWQAILALLVGLTATFAVFFLLSTSTTWAAVLKVNSTADHPDANPGDGTCKTADGVCTLRAAIAEANALAGSHMISFNTSVFSPYDPATITITGDRLPDIRRGNVTIDGTIAGVIIDGSHLSSELDDGFRITSNNKYHQGTHDPELPRRWGGYL